MKDLDRTLQQLGIVSIRAHSPKRGEWHAMIATEGTHRPPRGSGATFSEAMEAAIGEMKKETP